MSPTILLTCSPGPGGAGGDFAIRRAYVQAVIKAGGTPLMLPNAGNGRCILSAVHAAAGLLLTGGGDLDPAIYGQSPHAETKGICADRDAAELLAVRAAVHLGRPVLGICRGAQMLNVALGGTLIQDVPQWQAGRSPARASVGGQGGDAGAAQSDRLDEPVVHSSREGRHEIRVLPGSMLAGIWPERIVVNSRHHQAVDVLAPALLASAWADDETIEAVESRHGLAMLGLQCHPEDLIDAGADGSPGGPPYLQPFKWIVDSSRAAARIPGFFGH